MISTRLQNQRRMSVFSMVYPTTNLRLGSSRMIWLKLQSIFSTFWKMIRDAHHLFMSTTYVVNLHVRVISFYLSRGHYKLPEDFVIVSRLVVDVALVDTVAIGP